MKIRNILLLLFFLISTVFLAFQIKNFELYKYLEIYSNVMKNLNENYYADIDFRNLIVKNLKNTLSELDPYTNFYSESEKELVQEDFRKQKYNIEIDSFYNGFYLIKVNDSLLIKDKLKIGDKILEIDNISLEKKTLNELNNILDSKKNKKIVLKIKRANQIITTELVIKTYDGIKNIFYTKIDNIGYIKLREFTQNSFEEFKKALIILINQNIKALIIDLRDNPGGLLDQVVKIAGLFLKENTLVVYTEGKNESFREIFITKEPPITDTLPLVVLVNNNSASASEILAGVFQDYDRAVIIGTKTFGKGLVQKIIDVGYNNTLKMTISHYYLPSGRCVQKIHYFRSSKIINQSNFLSFKGRPLQQDDGINPDISVTEINDLTLKFLNSKEFFLLANEYENSENINQKKLIYDYFEMFISEDDLKIKQLKSFSSLYPNLKNACNTEKKRITDSIFSLLKVDYVLKRLEFEKKQRNVYDFETIIKYDDFINKAIDVINTGEYKKILKID